MNAAPEAAAATPGFRMLRTLTAIAMLSGLVVVLVYQWTKPIIAENQRIATERAVFQVVAGASQRKDFVIRPDGLAPATPGAAGDIIYAAYDDTGKLKGIAMPAASQGYQDMVRLLYGYDPYCQCILAFKVLKMTETPGLGDKILSDPEFLANFGALDARLSGDGQGLANPIVTVKHGAKKNPWEIDAISGATITSNAVGKGLNDSAQALAPVVQKHLKEIEEAGK